MRLHEDEIRVRRNKIMDFAYELFCEKGIEQVPMGRITELSGVRKRTMYRYFNNSMSLVADVWIQQWEMFMEDLRESISFYTTCPQLTGREQIVLWLEVFQRIYKNNAPLILFSYEAKLNIIWNKVSFTNKQMHFFTHGIRGPCIAALEKGKRQYTVLFS